MKKAIAALAAAAALTSGCAALGIKNPNGVPPAPPSQDPSSFFITP